MEWRTKRITDAALMACRPSIAPATFGNWERLPLAHSSAPRSVQLGCTGCWIRRPVRPAAAGHEAPCRSAADGLPSDRWSQGQAGDG